MILAGTDPQSIAQGAQVLRSGALLGLPTETVYGLAADASNDTAVAAIFAAKGRPADHPLIVHVGADDYRSAVDHFCDHVPAFALALMQAFWPGPLTLIVPRRAGVAQAAAGAQASVGLRCPAHPVAQALLQALRQPPKGEPMVWGLAAPSANRFGRVSPTTAAHVQEELGTDLIVLDGGACAVGIESTIIDCTRGAPVLLRPGAITRQQIEAACQERVLSPDEASTQLEQAAPRASGTLQSHYAPSARVRLMDAKALQAAMDMLHGTLDQSQGHIAVYARTALRKVPSQIVHRRMPPEARAAAFELFAVLRELDAQGVKLIWIETPPDTPDWEGVRDRLQRAAA